MAQTSLTEEKIAEVVGVSRRTLGRIWAKAGIRRGTEQQEGSKPVSVVTTTVPETPFDPVQAARKKEHSDYLREQLKYLSAHIGVPELERVILWPMETELGYPPIERTTYAYEGFKRRQSSYLYLKIRDGQVHVSPAIERTEDWKFLQAHLVAETAPAIMEDYTEWVVSLAQLFSMCHGLLLNTVSETDKQINEKMQGIPGWQGVKRVSNLRKRGIHKWFYYDVYSLAVGQCPSEKAKLVTELIEAKPELVALRRSDAGLAGGTTAEIQVYGNVHKRVIDELAQWPQIREIRETHGQCQAGAQALFYKIYVIEKRGDFKGV